HWDCAAWQHAGSVSAMTDRIPRSAGGSQPTTEPSGADLWLELVTAAIGMFRAHDFHQVSLPLLAEATGREVDAVQQQFPSFDELVFAVIEVWNAERMEPILPIAASQGAVAFLRAIVQANIADPALMRLLTATVNIAAGRTSPIAPLLQQRWLQFHAFVQRALVHDIEVGREPGTMDPARGAEQLIAVYEGLQLQSMVRPAMNLLEAYDRAAHRLRDGWSHTYPAPIWDI
ncbi:TetR/AcrR family transcriptional regulator, partial [Amnibacterium endophyticum]